MIGMRAADRENNEGSALWLRDSTPAGSEVLLTKYRDALNLKTGAL